MVAWQKVGENVLKHLTSEKLIRLQLEANDWEDAIRQAAQPLLEEGKIKPSYIEGIIRNVKEAGPYIVITPHVALPHTRPEEGVIESAIGIATLKEPICFGNAENDPVKYVFCLCAVDSKSHLGALADLANLLENDAFYRLLDTTTDPKEIMDFLNQ